MAEILGRLDAAGVWYCIEGGWGVDALLGEQTREHCDLDLAVRMEDVERLCSVLAEFERDDVEWPASFVLTDARGRKVDAHPLTFDENGDGFQAKLSGGTYRWPREHLDARGRIGAPSCAASRRNCKSAGTSTKASTTSTGRTRAL